MTPRNYRMLRSAIILAFAIGIMNHDHDLIVSLTLATVLPLEYYKRSTKHPVSLSWTPLASALTKTAATVGKTVVAWTLALVFAPTASKVFRLSSNTLQTPFGASAVHSPFPASFSLVPIQRMTTKPKVAVEAGPSQCCRLRLPLRSCVALLRSVRVPGSGSHATKRSVEI
jgi:hypothetical protein